MGSEIRITTIAPPGIEGLDELAAELGVEESISVGIGLEGRSGKHYDLIALLTAHIKEMRRLSGSVEVP